MRRRRRLIFVLGIGGMLALASVPTRAGEESVSAPLPGLPALLTQVRGRLHTDEFLLDQYTFNERFTERHLDDKGRVRKITSALYEVYPSPEPGHTYRRLIERDGKALTTQELAQEDRKQDEKEAKASRRSSAAQEERARTEAEVIDELFRAYDFRILRREVLEGRSAILVTFQPRPTFEAATKAGRILQKFAGRAWVDEQDRQLVRVEAELVDDLSFGFGILARLKKGASAVILRRKVNDEIWLPAEARFVGQARILLVKAVRLDALSEYSEYKKFTVATESAVAPEPAKN